MGRVERRSALPQPRASTIEYAVRGEWRQSETDEGGERGTWYIGVPRELVAAFGATVVKEKIADCKAAMAAASDEAIEKAASAAAAPAAAAPKGGWHDLHAPHYTQHSRAA